MMYVKLNSITIDLHDLDLKNENELQFKWFLNILFEMCAYFTHLI